MAMPPPPNYTGRGLVNLVAELETRMSGSAPHSPLDPDLSVHLPTASTYLVVLFDGLGSAQLDHPEAVDLRTAMRASIDAPFPSTTTVSLSTVATGHPPGEHGMLGYLMWEPQVGKLINTIHMSSAWGEPIDLDFAGFLPGPNVWQRLVAAGREPIVVQPGNFADSHLTKVLYGGARFEGYWGPVDAVDVAIDVASHPNRLVFLYIPHVDLAAHISGQASEPYREAISLANTVWRRLSSELPPHVTLIGTADHGHVDIPEARRVRFSRQAMQGRRLFGDGRALYVIGDPGPLLAEAPATWVPRPALDAYWGPGGLAPSLAGRAPDGVLFMDDGWVGLTDVMNPAMVGHHGGLTPAEREVPLLVR